MEVHEHAHVHVGFTALKSSWQDDVPNWEIASNQVLEDFSVSTESLHIAIAWITQ